MKNVSRLFLFGALILVLLTAACGADDGTSPTLSGTGLPGLETSTPLGGLDGTMTAATEVATTAETSTAGLETPTVSSTESVTTQPTSAAGTPIAGTTQTPGIPVTGAEIVLVECQFCVDTLAHALLVLPDTATFEVVSPATSTTTSTTTTLDTNCSTIEVNNGKQVVLCSGPEMTPITLNICTDSNTCTNFPVDLLACPLSQSNTAVPNKTQPAPGTGAASATPTLSTLATPSLTATP